MMDVHQWASSSLHHPCIYPSSQHHWPTTHVHHTPTCHHIHTPSYQQADSLMGSYWCHIGDGGGIWEEVMFITIIITPIHHWASSIMSMWDSDKVMSIHSLSQSPPPITLLSGSSVWWHHPWASSCLLDIILDAHTNNRDIDMICWWDYHPRASSCQ